MCVKTLDGKNLQLSEILLSFPLPQDQFDNLEKHTQWGIEFVERYTKFVKERSEIELNYAKQIRYEKIVCHCKHSSQHARFDFQLVV